MNRRGRWALVVSIIFLVVLVLMIFLYFALFSPKNDKIYEVSKASGDLINPVNSLSNEKAVAEFNETFVYYMLYTIKAYNLHNPPLSNSKPVIQLYVGEDAYYSEIDNGAINVFKGEITNKDIVIRTTKEEAVKMLRSKDYVASSFESGNSGIELVESKSMLFGKGYLNLYQELTGNSITGNIIKIYVS